MKKNGLFLIGMLLSASVFADSTLRCGSSIISVGDTKAEMIMKCGTPLSSDDRTAVVENDNGTQSMVKVGETLMMDMGKNKFMAIVTVEDGVIKAIEDGPRHD